MRPIQTPWGVADSVELVAVGILSVSTPSHGGYKLSPERQAVVADRFPGFKTFAGGPWYEEDQDWAVVAIVFPEHFPAEAVEVANVTAQQSAEYDGLYGAKRGWQAVADHVSTEAVLAQPVPRGWDKV
jgi:hypothetical protein